ncbi:MAG: glycosyltransferase family 4 protein [Thermoplasmata archaeon]|nr:glycosyltransferase family 4 protein [Thermoplasmata archaeon]
MAAETLAAGFRERGHEVEVAGRRRTGVALASLAASPFDADPTAFARYCRLLTKFQPQLVYGFFDFDSSLAVACKARGIPYIGCVQIHWPACPIGTLYIEGQGPCRGPSPIACVRHMSTRTPPVRLGAFGNRLPAPVAMATYLKFRTRHFLLSSAAALIAPSQDARTRLESVGFTSVHAIHSGLDLRTIPASPWDGGQKIVLYPAGHDSERKGFKDFHAMAARLKPEFPEVSFRATNFAGDGVVDGSLYLPRAEFRALMARSYVVVTPVLWDEPFGFVALEAMACSKPVVTYGSGAIPELVRDEETGLVVLRGNVDRLVAAVRRLLLNEPAARALGLAGRQRAEEWFTADRMVDAYLAVGQQILAAR